jgi:hypothetical protein
MGGILVVEFVPIEEWSVISYWNDNLLSYNMNGLGVVVLLVVLWVMSSKVSKVDFWFGSLWG